MKWVGTNDTRWWKKREQDLKVGKKNWIKNARESMHVALKFIRLHNILTRNNKSLVSWAVSICTKVTTSVVVVVVVVNYSRFPAPDELNFTTTKKKRVEENIFFHLKKGPVYIETVRPSYTIDIPSSEIICNSLFIRWKRYRNVYYIYLFFTLCGIVITTTTKERKKEVNSRSGWFDAV
jgi:hypothetical protein